MNVTIRNLYEQYKREWCAARGYKLEDMDEKTGINGECYASFDEWYLNDYLVTNIVNKSMHPNQVYISTARSYGKTAFQRVMEEHIERLKNRERIEDMDMWMKNHVTGLLRNYAYGMMRDTTPTIKNVIFNNPATIVFWSDGTKTVVRCQDGEPYDPEKGLAMAMCKKMHGNKREYYHTFMHWLKKYKED